MGTSTRAARSRRLAGLGLWCGLLVVAIVLLTAWSDPRLTTPSLFDPSAWSTWASGTDPTLVSVSILRLALVGLTWYLLGATTIQVLARLSDNMRLVRLADALSIPTVRRVVSAGLGVSLAATMVQTATAPTSAPTAVAATTADVHVPMEPAMSATAARGVTAMVGTSPDDDRDATSAGRPDRTTTARNDRVEPPTANASTNRDSDAPAMVRTSTAQTADAPPMVRTSTERTTNPPPMVRTSTERTTDAPPMVRTSTERTTDAPPMVRTAADDEADDGGTDAPPMVRTTDGPAGRDGSQADGPHESTSDTWTVRSGDHLWHIAEHVVTDHHGGSVDERTITRYWLDLVEANRDRLPDRDNPDLILPGMEVVLPAVPAGSPAASGTTGTGDAA